MRVISLLCWYDEHPDMLAAHVAGLVQARVEVLVAVDGAYRDYPGGMPHSPVAQSFALQNACNVAGIRLELMRPNRLWAHEMEKRSALFRLADSVGADWYLVLDADEVLINVPPDLRDRLAGADVDVFELPYLDDPHPTLAYAEDADGEPYVARARHLKYRRSLFRGSPGIYVAGRHSRYIAADGQVLWGDPLWGDEPVAAERLRDFVFDHRSAQRGAERNLARRAFYDSEGRKELEGLPGAGPAKAPAGAGN